jgi:class 3 adenylate cyclase/CheY-like chemotaxis protein
VSEEASKDALSKVRHDLRTPINQILGYSELLQEDAEDKGQQGFVPDLKKIQAAARRLLDLIDDLLAPGKLLAAAAATGPAAAPGAPGASAVSAAPAEADAGEPPVFLDAPTPPSLQRHGTRTMQRLAGAVQDRLLVVDDNEMNRDMLSRRLKAKGFEILVAEDGGQALDKIKEGGIDLVLLDVMMPGISGLEVLKQARGELKLSPADLPIIMATAKDASEDVVEALRLGANDYVVKPLDFPVVLARVSAQLQVKRAKDEIERLVEDLEVRNRFIKNTFGRYLSDEIVDVVLESPEGLKLGGERRQVTILMSDLRGFTSVAERLGPEHVVRMLNHYLGTMADVIMKHRGTIDEFIGDAILVIFGAPVQRDDDAQRAVACATEMQIAMAQVNSWNRAEGLPEVEMGIALHTGEVVVGNIGSQKRAKYGVVGTTVNLTSRIETYTVGGQVLLSEATLRAAGGAVTVAGQMAVRAKGAREPIVAYDLRGIGQPWNVYLPPPEHSTVRLTQPVAVRYFKIEGKTVAEQAAPGLMVALSSKGADVQAEEHLSPMTNLKLHLLAADGSEVPGDLYAKVVDSSAGAQATFSVRFTSMPPEVEIFIKSKLGAK